MSLDSDNEDLLRGRGKRESGGASIRQGDPRFTALVNWIWGLLGLGFVTCVGLAANNLYQLNLTVARAADNSVVMNASLSDHEARLRSLERDVNEIQGKVFRGVDGYPQEPSGGH